MTGENRPGRPLRVGVLLAGEVVPAWVRAVLADVAAAPCSRLALAVLDDRPPPPARDRLGQLARHAVYELYARLDRRLFTPTPDPFARVSAADLLADLPVLRVRPERSRFSDRFADDDVAAIRGHDLDVLLRFGFRILRGEVLAAARHGVWSYHHDDNQVVRGGPPGFWEVMEDHAVTGSVLQVLSERLDGGRVIYRSWAPTHRRSVIRNRAHVYWKSTAFVGRCLRALAETGDPASGEAAREAPRPYAHRLYRKPGNVAAAALLARFALRAGRDKLAETTGRRQWFLAWGFHAGEAGEGAEARGGDGGGSARREGRAAAGRGGDRTGAGGEELFRFRTRMPPPDRFWADPFPLRDGGRWWMFFEEYRYRERRGHLRVVELDGESGPVERPPQGAGEAADRGALGRPALVEPFHLSYPCVFRWRGEAWMVPETAARREVRLYRAAALPDDWRLEAVLLDDVCAVDATPFEHGGRWWMLANLAVPGSAHAHDELHLFAADSPLGPWRPHRTNPVVSDARRARPAGLPFRWRGQLYRPAQDCSRRYGWAVALHRVLRLDDEAYEEEPVAWLPPRWHPGLLAFHTFNRAGGLTVIDGMRRIRRGVLR